MRNSIALQFDLGDEFQPEFAIQSVRNGCSHLVRLTEFYATLILIKPMPYA